jgi:TolA-binding protein
LPGWARKTRRLALLTLFLAGCSEAEVERHWRAGEESWEQGNYARAVDEFHRVVEIAPQDDLADDALMRLGDIHHLFLNRPDDALLYYRDLLKNHPKSSRRVEARMKVAEIFRGKKDDCAMAVVEFQEVLNEGPPPETAAQAQYRMAECYFRNGEIQQARTEYETLLATWPESSWADDAQTGVGYCFLALRRYGQALKAYQKVVESSNDPDLVADARLGMATAYEETGLLPQAEGILRDLLDKHPNRELVELRLKRLEERFRRGNRRATPR